mgnify:CR=1 FL=1
MAIKYIIDGDVVCGSTDTATSIHCKDAEGNDSNVQAELTKLNKPIIISFHIPIMTSLNEKEMEKFDKYYIIDHQNCDEITKKMIDLFIENKNIKAILCGHTHGYSTSMFALDKYQYGVSSAIIGNLYNITIK